MKGLNKMVDTDNLKKAVKHFQFYSKPSSGTSDTPATVGDINKLIKNTANLFNAFIEELEQA